MTSCASLPLTRTTPCWTTSRSSRNHRLDNDRPAIELGSDEVDGAAVHLHPGRERACVRIEAGECRKQRRMDIEHAIAVALHESGAQHAHETGERYESGFVP